jgi:hypothetical protein
MLGSVSIIAPAGYRSIPVYRESMRPTVRRMQVLMEESQLQALRRVALPKGVTDAHVYRDALRPARDR